MKTGAVSGFLVAVVGTMLARAGTGNCDTEVRHKPIALEFASSAATATLIGFSEFGTASMPPKKYRRQITAGRLSLQQRVLAGTEACVGGRKVFGALTQDLAIEDKEEDAEARAARRTGGSAVAYRTSRTTGFRFEFQDVAFKTRFKHVCPGDYNLVVVYTTKSHGSAGPESKPVEVVLRQERFAQSETVVEGRIKVKAAAEVFNRLDVDHRVLSVHAVRVCTDGPPGSAGSALGSVHAWLNLGRNAWGGSVGQLRIDADDPAGLGSPAALRLTSTAQDGVTVGRGAGGGVVSRVARTYRMFAWGEEVVREVMDPGGAAPTTQWEYYDNLAATDPNFGKLKLRIEVRGHWERLSYDEQGRVVKRVRPFLNAPPDSANEAACRVTESVLDQIPDRDGDGQTEALRWTLKVLQVRSLTQSRQNDPHFEETSSAQS